MLFKVIYHQRKPSKTSETFNRGWAAILISETSSVVSTARSVTSVLFDSLHFFFFFRSEDNWTNLPFYFKIDVLIFFYIQIPG